MLIEEGASVNAGNQEGETALIHAAFNGNILNAISEKILVHYLTSPLKFDR